MSKMPVLKDKAGVVAAISTAIAHTKKGDALIHAAAIQALLHAAGPSGDPVYIARLVAGLGKSVRVEGLKFWVETYSPVTWNGDGKIGLLPKTSKKYKPFDCQAAWDNPFWTLEGAKETIKKPLTLEQLIAIVTKLPERLEKAVTEGKFLGDATRAQSITNMLASYAEGLANPPVPANTDTKAVVVTKAEPKKRASRAKKAAPAVDADTQLRAVG